MGVKEKDRAAYDEFMKTYSLSPEDLLGEIWKAIKGYEDIYRGSNFGRVKNIKSTPAQILKPFLHDSGYLNVNLRRNGVRKLCKIHRLVAEAFIPNPESKPSVNHIDGNKLNNHVDNLEWATAQENSKHAAEMGLYKTGENNPNAKLNNKQVIAILALLDAGFSANKVAEIFNVSAPTIYGIKSGKRYKDCQPIEEPAKNTDSELVMPPAVSYCEQLVLTTEQVAEFYETDVNNLRMNFFNAQKKGYFVEGVHYFKVDGEDLKALKNRIKNSYAVGKNATTLYFWTKRGCARHAKMLNTEKAWQVFEKLEDNYFNPKSTDQTPETPTEKTTSPDTKELSTSEKVDWLRDIMQVSNNRHIPEELLKKVSQFIIAC